MHTSSRAWIGWATGEGLTKTAQVVLFKSLGLTGNSFKGAIVATLIIGAVQMIVGFVGAKSRGSALGVSKVQIFSGTLFGVFATVATVMGIYAYMLGAQVGVFTFLIVGSIIPGALVDWLVFGNRLRIIQWFGVGVFLGAGWAVLDFPTFQVMGDLPLWVWIALFIALLMVANEAIMQKLSRASGKVDLFVNSFWIGVTTFGLCSVFLIAYVFQQSPRVHFGGKFWLVSLLMAVLVVVMIACKLLSYQVGGTIGPKKLVMQSVFLATSICAGIALYHEPVTLGKCLGLLGFIIAFALIDQSKMSSSPRLP